MMCLVGKDSWTLKGLLEKNILGFYYLFYYNTHFPILLLVLSVVLKSCSAPYVLCVTLVVKPNVLALLLIKPSHSMCDRSDTCM